MFNTNKKNQDIFSGITRIDDSRIDKNIKNLLIIANLTKFKKSDLTKSKKPKLIKSKKSDLSKFNFIKINSETDFLAFKTKKTFIYLQKTFIETPIL